MKKASFHFPWPSNLFFKASLILLTILVWGSLRSALHAINISAVYSSACQRDIGVIIDVDDSKIRLLTLSGEIKSIDRYNIVYVASYPAGDNPIAQVKLTEEARLIVIKTVYNNEVVDLVKGWMIDSAEDQISFLTVNGTETVLDNDDIWDIELLPMEETIQFPVNGREPYRFVHPYPFMHCNNNAKHSDDMNQIYPQHLLEDRLLIKKELDRLNEGYERLRGYSADKVFYPKPQVYGNNARLGFWGNIGSRYGASRLRKNNFVPVISSESSDGPFGFQRILVTGNALMPSGVHEEPQMQFYYRLKADYVHFAIMVDFNRFVIGESEYKWHKEDLQENDHRENDKLNIGGGFDYGNFAVDLSIWNSIQYGVRVGENFHDNSISLNKLGVSFENRSLKAEFYSGFGEDQKEEPIPLPDSANDWEKAYIDAYNAHLAKQAEFSAKYVIYRLNLTLFSISPYYPRYSLIYRALDFERGPDLQGNGAFSYEGTSLTNALYVEYPLDDEISLSGYVSIELLEKKYGVPDLSENSSQIFPKGGLNIALVF